MNNKIYDCITFFQETLQTELRINILKDVVDFFVVCESNYDHRGRSKKINFDVEKYPSIKDKIIHLILNEPFPKKNIPWENQAYQREYLFKGLEKADNDDLVMFSDPDEIPNPKILKNIKLTKRYAILMQKMYTYKLNIYNQYESPWEGTRICKKNDLKSIDWLRQKVVAKNLKYSFWRPDKERSIQFINNGGWHFNYLLEPKAISKKLKSLAETKWDNIEYHDVEKIRNKINQKKDLFNRGHVYKLVDIDNSYPDFIIKNKEKLKDWIV